MEMWSSCCPGKTSWDARRDNHIQIVSEKISRNHAKLVVSEEGLELIDLGSTNGTFVNETRLERNELFVLKPGDEVRFGDRRFHLKQSS